MFVVFDLDGTLADIRHRVHHVRGPGRPDWDAFFAECVNDSPNEPVLESLVAHRQTGHRVEIWSARSDKVRAETEEWMMRCGLDPWLLAHMRADGDNTPDVELKRSWLLALHPDERPDLIYDDRQRVVDMWRAEGIPCFQVAPNWEADGRVIAPVCDPLLTIMVGPSGAGKSQWVANSRVRYEEVLSSDALREYYTGDFRSQERNDDVFIALHRIAKARLDSGLPVTIDATNLRRRDRLACVALAPAGAGVRYVVVDRPLADKLATRWWRSEELVRKHHERMQSVLKDVLAGDGLPQVTVVDVRQTKSDNFLLGLSDEVAA